MTQDCCCGGVNLGNTTELEVLATAQPLSRAQQEHANTVPVVPNAASTPVPCVILRTNLK